jgi:S1-C subfamily serine protease
MRNSLLSLLILLAMIPVASNGQGFFRNFGEALTGGDAAERRGYEEGRRQRLEWERQIAELEAARLQAERLRLENERLTRPQELTPAEVFASAAHSVVVVSSVDAYGQPITQGSGVVLESALVVTNCHVYAGAVGAVVRHGSQAVDAELLHMDPDRDVCSFRAPGLVARPALQGSVSELRIGDPVIAIGAPRGLDLTLSNGLVSGLRRFREGAVIQMTAPISPGSSGGGLFNSRGALVGLTTLYFDDSQQLNFAIPIEWTEELPSRIDLPEVREAIVDFGAAALDDLELKIVDDPLYQCKRSILVPELRPTFVDVHPAHWAGLFEAAYEAFDDSQCSSDDAGSRARP